jgi:hypothetical protein
MINASETRIAMIAASRIWAPKLEETFRTSIELTSRRVSRLRVSSSCSAGRSDSVRIWKFE